MMPGLIAKFNMWDYELAALEIASLGCNVTGNIVNKDTLQIYGSPTYSTVTLTQYIQGMI